MDDFEFENENHYFGFQSSVNRHSVTLTITLPTVYHNNETVELLIFKIDFFLFLASTLRCTEIIIESMQKNCINDELFKKGLTNKKARPFTELWIFWLLDRFCSVILDHSKGSGAVSYKKITNFLCSA